MSLGTGLQAINTRLISTYGTSVVRKRRPTTDGGTAASATYKALVYPLNQSESAALIVEGASNVAEENPHLFTFAAGSDVDPATDWLEWDGDRWRCLNVTNPPMQGTKVDISVYAVREGAA